jgi:hypothetical protein
VEVTWKTHIQRYVVGGRIGERDVVGRHIVGRYVVGVYLLARDIVGRHIIGRDIVGTSLLGWCIFSTFTHYGLAPRDHCKTAER